MEINPVSCVFIKKFLSLQSCWSHKGYIYYESITEWQLPQPFKRPMVIWVSLKKEEEEVHGWEAKKEQIVYKLV